ncbi:probable L-type lectin-domain containing receptor kinase VI.1 [Herrania umbratica]|uniref:non-specific serine/threonine protein kinase n=1 Tax=Herrania umbratica TaxID=108875 RepID=A0A6J1ARK0_9ROSI|nr:probable L-type lectin-domain containing receptor kinase VI.1 [Herrania umbratica]
MASAASLTLFFCFFPLLIALAQSVEFNLPGFNASETNLTREGASIIKPTGVLRLTNKAQNVTGNAFYYQPIPMLDGYPSACRNASSFSTSFVFDIVPSSPGLGGYGLAFTLSPSPSFPGAGTEHYLGIFNSANDGNETNHIFAVEFDTVNGHNEKDDRRGNHVGININSVNSRFLKAATYYVNGTNDEDLALEGEGPIHAWIAYDGVQKVVNVTVCPLGTEKPTKSLISEPVDLTSVVKETMYVGFSASTGRKSSSHYILGWSFSTNGEAPALNTSQLPTTPVEKSSSKSFEPKITAIIAALSVVTVLLLVSLISLTLYRRMTRDENLEAWELDYPHRFSYKDLHTATKRFKESELIGVGGFGAVYRGVLPSKRSEVAVKRISRTSVQGMREFAAEIESLGRLRHKHLVNLQGWCKKKNDLLLVYDYIPNGSLDTLLFNPKDNFVLSWARRFDIIKGIGAGLLYLHEEWEQVVIHRDVKSSNVMIDAEMNARLGDFGLARLYDHGTASHTTNVVGTIGYIAPELARNGKASTSTDVFAYGVLLHEIATGRRPTDSGNFFLVDWVMECRQMSRILDAADPKLNSNYVVEEMELILELGLLCSHQRPGSRPTMRQVMQYLNEDGPLPFVDDERSTDCQSIFETNASSTDCQSTFETNARILDVISKDSILTSHNSSSIGAISSTSISAGR